MGSRFGVLVAQSRPWADLKRDAGDIETAGFHSLWVADQFANPFGDSEWLDGWSALAGLALITNTIRLGTLVTTIVYRHPAVIAKQAITVDHMSSGRLTLGIGAGAAPADHLMTGTPYWSGAERQRRFSEFVRVVEQLMSQQRSSFHGQYFTCEEAYISPLPVQRPRIPLLVAAHGPKSLRLAAEHADTWSFFEPGAGLKGKEAADAIRRMNALLDEKAQAAGRDPRAITRSLCCGFSASTAWRSLDEALSAIELFEEAGVDEFILTYSPTDDFVGTTKDIEVSVLLRNPDDLRNLAGAVLA